MAMAQIPKSVVASKMNMTRVFKMPAINKTMDGTLSLFVAEKTPKMVFTLPPIINGRTVTTVSLYRRFASSQ